MTTANSSAVTRQQLLAVLLEDWCATIEQLGHTELMNVTFDSIKQLLERRSTDELRNQVAAIEQ
jgi:hypothetical protein